METDDQIFLSGPSVQEVVVVAPPDCDNYHHNHHDHRHRSLLDMLLQLLRKTEQIDVWHCEQAHVIPDLSNFVI